VRADDPGNLMAQLLAIQDYAYTLANSQAGLVLLRSLHQVLRPHADEPAGQGGGREQRFCRDLPDVFPRDKAGVVAKVPGQVAPGCSLAGEIDQLAAKRRGRRLDRACHRALADRSQRQRIAVDADNHRPIPDQTRGLCSIASGQRQRIRKAEDTVKGGFDRR
jgi:hypothetical protein